MSTKDAMDQLAEALKDPEYRYGWEANIAMAFIDHWNMHGPPNGEVTPADVHRVANGAAVAFLEQLSPTREMPDVPGMIAIQLSHSTTK